MTRAEVAERATQRAAAVAQDRGRRLHNERVRRMEAEHRAADKEARQRRATFRVVR